LLVFVLVTLAAILLQSSVNTINDYYDFVKGNDCPENSDDPNDAIMVYNNLNPKTVQRLGGCFMATALVLGIYPVYRGGWVTLVMGAVGCVVIIAYSAGKKPLSYLPVGEIVSGTVMGGMITPAVFAAYTGYANWQIFLLSAPLIFGIGLIMMANNICDIERDAPTGRQTLPILLSRPRARTVFFCCSAAWLVLAIVCIALRFSGGLALICILLPAAFPVWRRLFSLPFTPEQRKYCLQTILVANLCANTAYVAAILLHAVIASVRNNLFLGL
jgi:1,4-dihydroxy-2-naphthoate octaprenyltransferase